MADYAKLKVPELKELLKSRDIPLTGLTKKQQYIAALEANDKGDDKDDEVKHDDTKSSSKKRPASTSPLEEPQTKQQKTEPKVTEAQVAKSSAVRVPLDDTCNLTMYHVYVDPDEGLIFDASLNQTNASGNNNKVRLHFSSPYSPSLTFSSSIDSSFLPLVTRTTSRPGQDGVVLVRLVPMQL